LKKLWTDWRGRQPKQIVERRCMFLYQEILGFDQVLITHRNEYYGKRGRDEKAK